VTMIDPRDRLTEGVTRERLKMEAKRSLRPTIFFGVGLLVALAIGVFLLTHISKTFGHETYEVRFQAPTAFGIFEGFDDVRFRGVPAGTITKVERNGTQLVIVAKLRTKYGPIYKDARAEIRPITPLNDVYLDVVDPGTPKAGKAESDKPLPQSQTKAAVTVPEVLDTLQPPEREAFTALLDQLGNGMDDGGVRLQRAFVAVVPFLEAAGTLTHQIALRKKATKRLIHNTAVLTGELGRRETELKRLVATGAATLGTLQEGSSDFDATLAELGPTFTELRSSLAAVRGVVDDVDSGLRSLYPVADDLPQSLASVRSLNKDLRPAITALEEPLTDTFNEWSIALGNVTDQAWPALQALQREVPTVNRLTKDLVDCEKGVIGFFQWNASLSKFGDKNGPIPRGNVALGAPAIGLPGEPLRDPERACTPGFPARGVPQEKDLH
jgi:virulence factor Mce-like protein